MDEDHCEKKRLNEATDSIEISDEDEIVSLSPVESIVWDCTEVTMFNRLIANSDFLKKLQKDIGNFKTYYFINWCFFHYEQVEFFELNK